MILRPDGAPADDPVLRDLAERLLRRRLFKTFDLGDDRPLAERLWPQAFDAFAGVARAAIQKQLIKPIRPEEVSRLCAFRWRGGLGDSVGIQQQDVTRTKLHFRNLALPVLEQSQDCRRRMEPFDDRLFSASTLRTFARVQ